MTLALAKEVATGGSALEGYRKLADQLDALLLTHGDEGLSALHAEARALVEDVMGRLVLHAERGRISMLRLREIGSADEVLMRVPAEAAFAVNLDRVVLSRIDDGFLVPSAVHMHDDPDGAAVLLEQLTACPTRFEFPAIEGEVMRLRRPLLIEQLSTDPPGRHAFAEAVGCTRYLAAAISLEDHVVGFLHGDREATKRPLTDVDRGALGVFAVAFAPVYERALLRHRLNVQRQAMREVARWADTRTSELSDWPLTLEPDASVVSAAEVMAATGPSAGALANLLTRRELEVLDLMVKGERNANIARKLFVTEGTVKFHVKNILRKIGATNRSEATSRYLRLTLGSTVGEDRHEYS